MYLTVQKVCEHHEDALDGTLAILRAHVFSRAVSLSVTVIKRVGVLGRLGRRVLADYVQAVEEELVNQSPHSTYPDLGLVQLTDL